MFSGKDTFRALPPTRVKAGRELFLALMLCGVAAALLVLTGCGTPGYVRADAIEGTVKGLVQRHDAYVGADESLSELTRRIHLRDGELLLRLIEEAQKSKEEDEVPSE